MEFTRKDIALFPTQHGFLFLGILIAMLLGSINYNNNAGFILVFLLGSMAMISLAVSYRNLIGIRLTPGHPSPVFAGEAALFPVLVTAPDKRGQALCLFLVPPGEDKKTDRKEEPEPFSLPPGGFMKEQVPFTTGKRGYHIPGRILLESVFPLGLFRLRAAVPNTVGILVYPSPDAGIAGATPSGALPDGDEESGTIGPDDFQGLSPYQPGSPVAHISWKTLSRGKGVFIKNFTAETGREMLFDLDQTRGKDLEHRLSILCRALLNAEKDGYSFGLKLGAETLIRPASGKSHLHACLEAMALYPEGKEAP